MNCLEDPLVWWNGRYERMTRVRIHPLDRGFQFGDGVFETIRVQKGRPIFLQDHLERLTLSLKALGFALRHEYFPWVNEGDERVETKSVEEIINHLIEVNSLIGCICRVKVLISRGVVEGLSLPEPTRPTVLIMAFQYRPPEPEIYDHGWHVITVKDIFTPHLARYKVTSYLGYLVAKNCALKKGSAEALLIDRSGNISEGASSSILVCKDGRWVEPLTEWKLPGVTIRQVARILSTMGHEVTSQPVGVSDLYECETIWLMNSMVGIMPVCTIDQQRVPDLKKDLAASIRKTMFG